MRDKQLDDWLHAPRRAGKKAKADGAGSSTEAPLREEPRPKRLAAPVALPEARLGGSGRKEGQGGKPGTGCAAANAAAATQGCSRGYTGLQPQLHRIAPRRARGVPRT